MAGSLRRFFTNIICGFIPGDRARRRIRVMLNNPSARSYIKFVQQWADENCGGAKKISINFGVGCQNLIVVLNNAHVFKFSLTPSSLDYSREKRICNALRKHTTIRIPKMEIINWRGTIVRRYEFIPGKLLCDFPPSYVLANRRRLATQLAQFMFDIGHADPTSIRNFKKDKNTKPDYLYGWFHNDIGQNFLMDDKLNIIGFIDWDAVDFCDFKPSLYMAERFWNKNGFRGLMTDVLYQYSRIYYSNK